MAASQLHASKPCTKCGETKPLVDFYAQPRGLYGRHSRCRACVAVADAVRYAAARQVAPQAAREKSQAWRKANPERVKELKRGHYERHRAKVIAKAKEYQVANRDRRNVAQQAWRDRNRERVRDSQRRARVKMLATAKGRLELSVRAMVRYHLKHGKNGRKTFTLLPFTVGHLISHLERQFTAGMTWANYGDWHVDHIVPMSAHNFETADDPDWWRAWALTNLRPLWASENHRKSNKLLAPFQPSFRL